MEDLLAFGAEHVSRVTSLSLRQLAYWDDTGFFKPRYASENRRSPYSRVYSFRDVVGLRTLATLRKGYRVPLQELRTVAAWLAHRGTEIWASTTFYVLGRHVFYDDPDTGQRMSGRSPGQSALKLPMQRVFSEARDEVDKLRRRSDDQYGKISRNRYVVHNAAVLAGTRVPTSAVWNLHTAGYDNNAIIREYPVLTSEDIEAALAFEELQVHTQAG
jgi:uncharacterized protein (DUF433 family)